MKENPPVMARQVSIQCRGLDMAPVRIQVGRDERILLSDWMTIWRDAAPEAETGRGDVREQASFPTDGSMRTNGLFVRNEQGDIRMKSRNAYSLATVPKGFAERHILSFGPIFIVQLIHCAS